MLTDAGGSTYIGVYFRRCLKNAGEFADTVGRFSARYEQSLAAFIHLQVSATTASRQQFTGHGIADGFFHHVTQRTRPKTRMKSFSHEERQHGFSGFDGVAFGAQKLEFLREKKPGDFIAAKSEVVPLRL